MSDENKNKIEEELSKIKEEMQELKDMLREKRSSQDEYEWDGEMDPSESPNAPKPPRAPGHQGFSFKFGSDFDNKFDDIDINLDGIDSTLSSYLESVMKGVSDNIKRSLEGATTGIHRLEHDIARKAQREAAREIRRSEREIRNSLRQMRKRSGKSEDDHSDHHEVSRVIHLNKLTEEELEDFYEVGTKMVGALSDPRRLKLLKLLENGPAYQGDLSDATGVKGGTFKHHMDSLMESKYVYQEATRGRYLITQLGVEALKLAEMLYRRFKFEEIEKTVVENSVDVDGDVDFSEDVAYQEEEQLQHDDQDDLMDDEDDQIQDGDELLDGDEQ